MLTCPRSEAPGWSLMCSQCSCRFPPGTHTRAGPQREHVTCRGFARAVADFHLNGQETKASFLFRDKHQIGHRKGNVNCHHKNKTAFCGRPYATSPVFLSGDEEHFIIVFFSPHISGLFFLTSSSSLSLIPPPPHPTVQAQVHISHYSPAERYSPPLSPHLSPSFYLSPASVWSLLVLGDKLLPTGRSLFTSLFFILPFCLLLGATFSSWPLVPPPLLQPIQLWLFFAAFTATY